MKKTVLPLIVMCVIVLVAFTTGFTGCSKCDHQFGGGSCTTARVCVKCGYSDGKMGHIEVVDEFVAATCLKEGLSRGVHCSRCGYIIEEQRVLSKTGCSSVHGKCAVCNKITDPYDALAYYVKMNDADGVIDSNNQYRIITALDSFLFCIYTDKEAETLEFTLFEYSNAGYSTMTNINVSKSKRYHEVGYIYNYSDGSTTCFTGVINGRTFSEDGDIDEIVVTGELSESEYEWLFERSARDNLHLLLLGVSAMLESEIDIDVDIEDFGFVNYA